MCQVLPEALLVGVWVPWGPGLSAELCAQLLPWHSGLSPSALSLNTDFWVLLVSLAPLPPLISTLPEQTPSGLLMVAKRADMVWFPSAPCHQGGSWEWL